MLDELISLSRKFLSLKNNKYRRYLINSTNFNKSRISLILGQRALDGDRGVDNGQPQTNREISETQRP